MRLLIDRDAIQKLAAFNLLEETMLLLNPIQGEIYVLPAAVYALRKIAEKRRAREVSHYTIQGLERALVFAGNAKSIDDLELPLETALQNRLTGIEGIYPEGDLSLIMTSYQTPDILLLSGDKRFMKALSKTEAAREIFLSLRGRVICLESLLLGLTQSNGFEIIRERVAPCLMSDKAVRAAFGSGMKAKELNAVDALSK